MSIDFNYLGKTSNVTALDYVGQRLGLYRNTNESLEDFKERCISCFVYPSGGTNEGQSAGHARGLNQRVRNIGYIKIDPDYRIYFNGYSLVVYYADSVEQERVTELEYKLTDHISIERFKTEFEALSVLNEVVIDEDKYLTKDLCFLFPFSNYSVARSTIKPGTSSFSQSLGTIVIPESIRSDTKYLKNKVASAEFMLLEGDFFLDEESGRISIYESMENANTEFSIIYNYYMKYIPIWYCPVMSYQLSPIVSSSNNTIDIDSEEFNTFGTETNQEILDMVFMTKLVNAGWKNSRGSAESVSGTYYDK
jgi:hypothetical protein